MDEPVDTAPVDTAIGETFDATLEEKIIDLLEATGEVEEVFDEHIEAIGGYTDEIRFWDDFCDFFEHYDATVVSDKTIVY